MSLESFRVRSCPAPLFWELWVVLIQLRTLVCLLRHRPNAYYDCSNGPLFACE